MSICAHSNRIVIGDKAYVSAPVADELWQHNRIGLLSKPRNNQKKQISASVCRLFTRIRPIFDTVKSQLVAQFSIESLPRTLYSEVYVRGFTTKLTAHTLCKYINHLLDVHDLSSNQETGLPLLALRL